MSTAIDNPATSTAALPCPLLNLPVELRLLIYSFALSESPVITISAAELHGAHHDIVHRLYGDGRSPYPCILRNHEPVIEAGYNASLLSIARPAVIGAKGDGRGLQGIGGWGCGVMGVQRSLMLVNKKVHRELKSHFKVEKNRRTSFFISFPQGLHVQRALAPHLLLQARTVHLAGVYINSYTSGHHHRQLSSSVNSFYALGDPTNYHDRLRPDSAAQLAEMVSSFFGPNPTHKIAKFEMRVYYPGEDSYSTVWGDDSSPTCIALANLYTGDVTIEVCRGRYGTGVLLTATHAASGESKGPVRTVWRKLEEGRHREPKVGSWVVDPLWPHSIEGGEC